MVPSRHRAGSEATRLATGGLKSYSSKPILSIKILLPKSFTETNRIITVWLANGSSEATSVRQSLALSGPNEAVEGRVVARLGPPLPQITAGVAFRSQSAKTSIRRLS